MLGYAVSRGWSSRRLSERGMRWKVAMAVLGEFCVEDWGGKRITGGGVWWLWVIEGMLCGEAGGEGK